MEQTGKGPTSMMTQTELEARLLAVETALKEIQHRLAALPPPRPGSTRSSGRSKMNRRLTRSLR